MTNIEKQEKILKHYSNLKFDQVKHAYFVNNKNLKSVSVTLQQFYEPFDAYKIAGFVAIKRTRLEGKLYTREDILLEWEQKKNAACSKGHDVHNYAEKYKKGDVVTTLYQRAVMNFWDSIPDNIEPMLFELQMYCEQMKLAGTADLLLYNKDTGNFILVDYKTNEDLHKNFKGKTLLEPFTSLLDNNYNKYQLQLSYYQLLFELTGYKIESRKIVWLKPDGSFIVYSTKDFTKELFNHLNK